MKQTLISFLVFLMAFTMQGQEVSTGLEQQPSTQIQEPTLPDTIDILPSLLIELDTVAERIKLDPRNEDLYEYKKWMEYKIFLYEKGAFVPEVGGTDQSPKIIYRRQPAIKADYEGFLIYKIVNK